MDSCDSLIEALAELEHEQWVYWSRGVAAEVDETRRKRWETFWIAYQDLPEDVKEEDRRWARKVLEILARLQGRA